MKTKKQKQKNKTRKIKYLTTKAGLALKNQFYLDAAWLISEILEKRLKSLLEKVSDERPGAGFTFEQCIKRIKHIHVTGKNQQFKDHFEVKLIDKTRTWKNQRNTVVKDMLDVHVSKARKEKLAMDGIRLLKEWNRSLKNFKSESIKINQELPHAITANNDLADE